MSLLVPWCAQAQSYDTSAVWQAAAQQALWFALVPVAVVVVALAAYLVWSRYRGRATAVVQLGWQPLALALVVLAVGLGITYVQVKRTQEHLYTYAWLRFQQQVDRIESDIQTQFEKVLAPLRGLRGAMLVQPNMKRQDLRDWVASRDFDAEVSGVMGLGLIDKVKRADLSRYVQLQRSDHMSDYVVRSTGNAAELYLIKGIEPLARNRAAVGYDVGSEPVRRKAADRAMVDGVPSLTGRIALVQDQLQRPGFLYLLPIYNQPTVPSTPELRRASFRGWSYAPIVLAELIQHSKDTAQGLTQFQLFDDTEMSAATLIYDSEQADGRLMKPDVNQAPAAAMFVADHPMLVGGQLFQLRAYSSAHFETGVDLGLLSRLAFGGALLSLLAALAAWLLLVGRARAQAMANAMTHDLARLAMVARRTSNAVLFTDAQQRIVWANEGFTRLTGYSVDEALGQHPGTLLRSEHESLQVRAEMEGALAAGRTARMVLQNRAKDGHGYWVDLEIQTLCDADGAITGYMSIETDVTAQLQAREALEQERLRSERVLEGTNVGTWEFNCQTGESRVNARWAGMLGYALDELLPSITAVWERSVHPDDLVRSHNALNNCLAGPLDSYACELRIQHKSGQWMWILSRGRVLTRLPDGRAEWVAGIHMDISESKKTEVALRDMELFLDRAGRSAGLGAWQMDIKSGVLIWSDHTCEIHGLEPGHRPTLEQMLGYYPTAAQAQLRSAMEDSINKGFGWDLTLPFTSAHGVAKWVRVVGEVEFDDSGPVRWVGAFQDVTLGQQARLDAERSENLLRGAIDVINEAFVLYDPQDRLVFCNDKYRRLYAKSADLIVPGASFESIVRGGAERGQYKDALGRVDAWVAERVAIHRASDTELEQRLDDGKWVRVVERKMADGHIVGFRVDITELKNSTEQAHQASARLADTAAALQSVLDSAVNVAIFATDLKRIVTVFNQGAQRMLGYTPQDLIGVCNLRQLVDNKQLMEVGRSLAIDMGREPTPQELFDFVCAQAEQTPWTLVRKDGSTILSSLTVSPMVNGAGQHVGYLGIAYDISRQKEYEESLERAMAQAQESSIAKSQFLANMSHEIRTPMNAILGMLKLLSATALSERQRDYTAKTEGAARSLLGLLNDILDFSKVEAGKLELDHEPFSLGALMADLSVILSSNLGAKDVDIVFDIDPGIPDQLVGDALRLKQILINLAGNAVKFTEHGQVLIAWRLVAHKAQSVAVELAVSDSGIGIAPENQARIFEGFSQAESSTTRRFGGTGLGLAICTRLVGLMGGQLALKSALGEGSTFSFQLELPLPQDAHTAVDTMLAPSDVGTVSNGHRRVLLVDDNPVALRAAEVALQAMGWGVTAVGSGEQGLAQLRAALAAGAASAHPVFDAVFVDWHMPEVDGWQTLRLMRREFGARPLPKFVMLSAQGRELLGQRSKREQELIDAFLVKPLTGAMFASVFAQQSDAQAPDLGEAAESQHSQPLAGLHLLVVEDNAINQQVAQELLTAQGAQVTLAGNGRLGVEAIARAEPMFDLVLMDLQMPVMDGLSAARYIRNELALPDLPVVAMTANAMSSDREACLAAGMNDHVGKPFDLEHLVATVLRYCHRPLHVVSSGSPSSDAALVNRVAIEDALPDAAPVTWPHGVAGAAAVQRMGGNVALYRRTLEAMWEEALVLVPRLRALVAAKQLETLQREAHSLKGLARTVGVGALADCAAQLEAEAQSQASASELEEGMAALDACIQSLAPIVRALLAQLQEAPPPNESHPNDAGMGRELRALLEALEADDMQALDLHAVLRQRCPANWEASMAPLDAAMAQLDFAAAAQACKLLLDELRA